MKYLILKSETDDAIVLSPIPKNAAEYVGFKLFLNDLPNLPSGHKYVIDSGGNLTTLALNSEDVSRKEKRENDVSFREIDRATEASIEDGFTYDNLVFPLDIQSQLLYVRIYTEKIATNYTNQQIPTIDFDSYLLESADVNAFFAAYKAKADSLLETSRVAKDAILNQ